MKYKGFLTDMDGTITLTTPAWVEATNRAFRTHNVQLTEADAQRFHGRTMGDVLGEMGFDDEKIEAIRVTRDTHLPELFRTNAAWLPGADALLRKLQIPKGIVTSSRAKDIDILDECIAIRSYVDDIVTMDDVRPRHKPNPYPLILACERLHLNINEVLYMGDQEPDLQAAEAVGMDFVLWRGHHTPPTLRAKREASSYEEVQMILSA